MIDLNNLPPDLLALLKSKFKEEFSKILIPPTAFTTMKGELIEYNIKNRTLKTKFPVSKEYLNQFGNMQGGMIAAAIDNTLGPLSMLVGPPNFTRNLSIKYINVVHPDIGYIFVAAKMVDEKPRQLFFIADVMDKEQNIFATANATHWIINKELTDK